MLMQKIISRFLFTVAICGVALCGAADDVKLYMNADALPNALNFLPPPPKVGSAAFAYDSSQYVWGKSMRADSARLNVLKRGVLTMRLAARGPKLFYKRPRPYEYFNESTLIPSADEEHRNTGSFPSSHTVRGWAMALLLAEINPAAQDALLKYGYEWGQSRVIAGFHWQSDVDASKLIISGCYARLHADESFNADMRKARAEFKRLSAKSKR